jgi:3-oxoacyl-[acyl-carrier-protein] synthase II
MRAALKDAGAYPEEVGHVSAHATSTPLGDRVEAGAISAVFGDRRVPVSAAKSMTGHMLGASGPIEAAFAAMGLVEGAVPPTANLDDPEFDLGLSTELRKADIRAALVNSFAFGGSNSVLLLRRVG